MPGSAAAPAAAGAEAASDPAPLKRGEWLLVPGEVRTTREGPVLQERYFTVVSVTNKGESIKAQARTRLTLAL